MPEDSTISDHQDPAGGRPANGWRTRTIALAAGVALLVVGVVAGAAASRFMGRHHEAQPLMPPVAISAVTDDSVVAVKGKVGDIFGNKFIVEDASGRVLVETGRHGRDGTLVARDETVTVQGHFEDGFLRGSMIVHADGKTDLVGHAGGRPGHGPKGWGHRP